MATCECPHCGNRQEFDDTGGRNCGDYRLIEVECEECGEYIEMRVDNSPSITYRR